MSDATAPNELSKAYKPAEHERRIWDRWMAAKAFHADPERVLRGAAQPYCIVIPPPNVTAALHLGHALNNTLQDILSRAHRMMGFETLWMPGTDHAGIATQAVVEKRVLKEEKKRRTQFGRDEFVAKIQAYKDEYEAVITGQLKAMGCSCDWDRQRFTMDETCARAVREAFFRLFRDGLIYRGKRLVNWDPALQTAVADDECYDEEIDGHFYYLRYPLVHPAMGGGLKPIGATAASTAPNAAAGSPQPVTWNELAVRGYPGAEDHPPEEPAWITVATTRPETYLGDTAVAVNPHDPRARSLRGFSVKLPLIGRVIPIVEDPYVVLPESLARTDEEKADPKAKMATGFLKVTPAHDANDYALGQTHRAAIEAAGNPVLINMMSPDGRVSDKHGWSVPQEIAGAHMLVGKTMAEARKLVVKEFESHGLFEGSKPHRHSVKHSDRSKAVIEPYLSDQWYVKVTDPRLAAAANAALAPEQRTGTSGPQTGASGPGTGSSGPQTGDSGPGTGGNAPRAVGGGSGTQASLDATPTGGRGTPARGWDGPGAGSSAAPQSSNAAPQGYGAAPQGRAGAPQGRGEAPQGRGEAPQGREGAPQGREGAPQGWDGAPQGCGGAPKRSLPPTSGSAPAPSGDGSLRFTPARYARAYEHWHDNIRDWCISRQLWWGHRIPVWKRPGFFVPQSELDSFYRELGPFLNTGRAELSKRDPLAGELERSASDGASHATREQAKARSEAFFDQIFVCVRDTSDRELIDVLERYGFAQDDDVLDTWFSSALWPLSTMGWPDDTALLRAFNPTTTLCTAREIITLWVSRMVMFNRYLYGEGGGHGPSPFHNVFIHAVIQDGNGQKMSKSLGNGVDPLDIIESHGCDAMRFALCQMTTQTQDVRLPVVKGPNGKNTSPKFDLGRNFANKLWNASRFVMGILADPRTSHAPNDPHPHASPTLVDRWMLSRLAAASAAADRALDQFEFSEYANTLYSLLWNDYCDWYLEAVKPTIAGNPAQAAVLRAGLDVILRLLHPVMPFVTETIDEQLTALPTPHTPNTPASAAVAGIDLGAKFDTNHHADPGANPSAATGLLCRKPWPRVDPALRDPAAEAAFERIRALVTLIRDVRARHQVAPKRRINLHLPRPAAALNLDDDALRLIRTFAGIEAITDDAAPGVAFAFESCEMRLSNLADPSAASTGGSGGSGGAGASDAERTRLSKLIADLAKEIAVLEGRLANPGYADKAPPHMVQQTRDQLAKKLTDRAAAAAALAELGPGGS